MIGKKVGGLKPPSPPYYYALGYLCLYSSSTAQARFLRTTPHVLLLILADAYNVQNGVGISSPAPLITMVLWFTSNSF